MFVLLEHFKKHEETIQLNQLSSTCNNRQIHKFIPEFFSLQQRKKLVDLQKERYLLKNSQAVKKDAALARVKKVVKCRWQQPRNSYGGRSAVKNLIITIIIMTIRVNLVLITVVRQPELSLLIFLSLTYHHLS